jgi:hypothetical protein
MKTIPLVLAAIAAALVSVRTQDAVSSDFTLVSEASIPGPISDGTPSPPPPEPEPIPFQVETSVTKRVHVVESPEMPGLPAPEGDINITVQLVKDPGLPDPPPPMPPAPPDDPAVLARMAELVENYRETQLVFVSATVYDHSRTFLRCYPSGNGHREEISAWSNLDFNHFSGFATFQVKGTDGEIRQFGLVMALGNEEIERTRLREQRLVEHDIEFEPVEIPQLPDLATSGPAFVVTEGDTTDQESIELIEGMHNLYKVEGSRMEEAYHARIKAYEERKAYLLANPPKPDDVTIQFWRRENPSPAGLQIIEREGQP